ELTTRRLKAYSEKNPKSKRYRYIEYLSVSLQRYSINQLLLLITIIEGNIQTIIEENKKKIS
ncbi:hypothetical protein EBU71_20690, partial [bacterium]|nr:hypothetical protein [Candidatus Elulimicrobium humile]